MTPDIEGLPYDLKAVCSDCGRLMPTGYSEETKEAFVTVICRDTGCKGNIILVRPDELKEGESS